MNGRAVVTVAAAALGAAGGAVGARVALRRRAHVPGPTVRTGTFANGVRFAALGDGPRTMVFLPGGPGTGAWEKSQARGFLPSYATGEFTIWWLSRRPHMPTGYTVDDMADDVADVIVELGGHVDAVMGASYGGLIALHLAARHPDRVGRVVLLASSAVVPDEAKEADRRMGEPWGNGRFTEAGEGMLEELVPGAGLRWLRRLLAPLGGRMLASLHYDLGDVLVETQAEMGFDARPVLPQITPPVLIVAGGRDRFLPREAIEETARGIRACTVIWHEKQGHVGTIRDRRTRDEVLAFLGDGRVREGAEQATA